MKTLFKHGANIDHLNKVSCSQTSCGTFPFRLASDKLLVHVYQSTFHVLCGQSFYSSVLDRVTTYRIAGIFRGYKCSRIEPVPRKFIPTKIYE